MTVREWFRILRGSLWEQDISLAVTVNSIVSECVLLDEPFNGSYWLTAGPEVVFFTPLSESDKKLAILKSHLRWEIRRRKFISGLA